MGYGIIDITGQMFRRLTVDGFAYTTNNRAYWNCTCDFGTHCVLGEFKDSDIKIKRECTNDYT